MYTLLAFHNPITVNTIVVSLPVVSAVNIQQILTPMTFNVFSYYFKLL